MSASLHEAELQRWTRLLEYESASRYRWAGQAHGAHADAIRLPPAPGYPLVVAAAAEAIYDRAYLRSDDAQRAPPERSGQVELGRLLHEANAGTGSPKGSSRIRAGWYYARSDVEHRWKGKPVVRLYWNVPRAGAGVLLRALTSELNAARIPFDLKVADDPGAYHRCDVAVLYLQRSVLQDALEPLQRAHAAFAPYLRAPTPALTKRIARGVAAADEPAFAPDADGPTESFGTSRARLVAEGAWDAFARGEATPEARWAAVQARFARAGIRVDAPYLNAGSEEIPAIALADAPLPVLEATP